MIALPYANETEWHAIRRRHITGTDVAAIAGCSPFKTALDVYADKLIGPVPVDSDAMRFGRLFEAGLLEELACRLGRRIYTPKACYKNERFPWLVGTFDGAVIAHDAPKDTPISEPTCWEALAEAKTSADRSKWCDGVPSYYEWQVQTYMLISRLPRCHVVVMLGVNDIEVHEVIANGEVHAQIVSMTRDFMELIQQRKPPEPDWMHPKVLESIRRIMPPRVPKKQIQLNTDAATLAREYLKAQADEKDAETRKNSLRAKLEVAMGDAAIGIAEGVKVSLIESKRARYEVPKEVQERYQTGVTEYTTLKIKEVAA